MKKYYLIVVVVLLCHIVNAQQTMNLKGIVVDTDLKGNITPIQGAYIRWLNETNIVISDSNGVFIIPFTENTNNLIVSYVGYKTDTIFVAEKKFVKILLITKNKLKDVNISVERKSSEVSFIDPWKTTIMNEKELFKAACCNLSESFETNPSVDVNLTDAITGTKQIQMLGLASQYTQLTQEMIPGARGLAVNYGNAYTPGSWINSIQVTKGIGSVVNGFESIAGQINTELHKPDVKEKVYFNAYASEGGRYETNLIVANKLTKSFSQSFLLHGSTLTLRMDNNSDGYLDNPLGYQINSAYRFKYDKGKGFIIQGGLAALNDKKIGGQFDFDENNRISLKLYGTKVNALKGDAWLKIGYVFPRKIYKSLGLQVSTVGQSYDSYFGNNLYKGKQESVYANFIYQSIISSSDHKFRTGFSYLNDYYDEVLENFIAQNNTSKQYEFKRDEKVIGAFFEYTYSYLNKFTLVAGQRLDFNNLYGWFYTPRVHTRLAINKQTVLRASAGRGQRTANIIAENTGLLASSRKFIFNSNNLNNAYGLNPEVAWNYGLSLTSDFKLNYRKGSFSIDYYYTYFQNQIVVDREAMVNEVRFYNLNGKSYSNSIQVQLDYEPIKRLDVRLAYRYYDVKAQYDSIGVREVPLIAAHRAFFNIGYNTKNKWNFDFTWNWIGSKRLPNTSSNPAEMQLPNYSESFIILNTQVSKSLFNKKLDIYTGIENLLDFKQSTPIIDAQNPFGSYFDASMVWGPVFGRMIYGGVRFKF
jgi:outer membrane receptor for ferrienterochelin and colicin